MITKYESDSLSFQDDKLALMQELQEYKSLANKQEQELKVLREQLEEHFSIREEFTKMKLEYDKLLDSYHEIEGNYKEMTIRFQGLEKSYHYIEKERESSHQRILELTNMLNERSVESNNEKKALRDFLARLEKEKGLSDEKGKQMEKDFSSFRVAKQTTKPFNMQDYFVRLKTTSVSSDKYAETIEVLYELYKTE